MRGLFFAVLLLTTIASAALAADDAPQTLTGDAAWAEYKKLLGNYYFLDQQKAAHISCHVSDTALQTIADGVHVKFGEFLTLDENLRDFSVTYDRSSGISFNTPHVKVGLAMDIKSSALEQQESQLEKIFTENIDYAEIVTTLALMDMISSSPEKQKNLSLIKNGNFTVASYDIDGNNHNKVIYSGAMKQVEKSSPTIHQTSISNYQLLDGKLVLAHSTAKKIVGSEKTTLIESVSYQNLGSSFFPAQISVDAMTSHDTEQAKLKHIEFAFTDCKTSDVSP